MGLNIPSEWNDARAVTRVVYQPSMVSHDSEHPWYDGCELEGYLPSHYGRGDSRYFPENPENRLLMILPMLIHQDYVNYWIIDLCLVVIFLGKRYIPAAPPYFSASHIVPIIDYFGSALHCTLATPLLARYIFIHVLFSHMIYVDSRGPSWSWSYCSWICNYLCNQYMLPLMFWVRIPLRRGVLLQHYVITFVSTSGYSGFPHQ
jgi:hypothetical protein